MSKPIYGDTVGGGGTNLKKIPQSDWNQADQTQLDFIKNKPDIYTKSEVDDLLANVEAGNVNVQEIVDAAVDVARTEAANQDAVVLAEVQAAVEAAKVEAANQDTVVLAEVQANIENKADKATTLAGYNISDAYTKAEVDDAISNAAAGVQYTEYIATDEAEFITVDIANNHIIKIDGYRYVTIALPDSLSKFSVWDCYFYIAFRRADSVALHLPESIRIIGDRPSYALPGDLWEISINNQGGAVCVIHRYQASLDVEE